MRPPLPRLNLIGAGRLGRTLASLWHRAGVVEIGDVVDLEPTVAMDAVRFISTGLACNAPENAAELTLIATRDDAIGAAAEVLATSPLLRQGHVVFHCSGALASEILEPVHLRGAMIASVHPMKSFALPAVAADSFAGTICAEEGDIAALATIGPLFDAIGAHRITIDAQHKLLYHAGAVMACNHLVALMEGALRCLQQAGLPNDIAWQALRPLINGTLAGIDSSDTRAALTGPIARGDLATVQAECAATQALDPDIGRAYAALSALALQLTPAGHPIRRSDLGFS